ncbi:hypothetical protein BASA81_000882 [Batrachochytrium salamandrivorans]|nr:hypothetical protein BASA81_000882 [Batrachochytrium salamandrivorans]
MQTLLGPCQFHKKGLGFSSPSASSLVAKSNLLACKLRYFALVESPDGDVELRYFKSAPTPRALACYRGEIVTEPSLSLSGLMVLDRHVICTLTNQLLSICTKERTWLICSREGGNVDELETWARVLQTKLPVPRSNRLSIMDAIVDSSQNESVPIAMVDVQSELPKFDQIWLDLTKRQKFQEFLRFSFAEENFLFYQAVEQHIQVEGDFESLQNARDIVNLYVKDSGRLQVNVSSAQRHALLREISLASPLPATVTQLLMDCQKEIYDLMRRNFFFRFQATFEAEQRRAKVLNETHGCFSELLDRYGGVRAFQALATEFDWLRQETKHVVDLVDARLEMARQHLPTASITSTRTAVLSSSAQAVGAVLELRNVETTVLHEYEEEIDQFVRKPLLAMQRNVETGFSGLRSLILPALEGIQRVRETVTKLTQEDSQTKQKLNELNASILLLLDRPEQELTTAQDVFAKLQEQANGIESHLSDAEVALVSMESSVQTDLQRAFDQLESLVLYWLDTMRDLLQRLVLAEQSMGSRLDLKLSGMLNECCNVDAVGDLIEFSERAQRRLVIG